MTGLVGVGFMAKVAAKATGAKAALSKIPWQIWAIVGFLLFIGIGSCVHGKKVEKFGTERYTTGYNEGRKSRDAEIKALQRQKAEADKKLAAALRSKADEANKRIDATAGRLLLSGPGKATCPNPPRAVTSTSGHEPAAPEANAAGLGVPSEDFAAVPWNWLVRRATEHDKCLIEAGSWRAQKEAEIKAYNESLTHAP